MIIARIFCDYETDSQRRFWEAQPIIRPVILCGGAGTRLWPVSRKTFPKQLLPVIGDRSLLQQTAARLSGEAFAPAIVVSGEDQRFFIQRQLNRARTALGSDPARAHRRATPPRPPRWPPHGHLIKAGDETSAAHAIGPCDRRPRSLPSCDRRRRPHAENGAIVTFGAKPTGPNTQYGYIEADESACWPTARSRSRGSSRSPTPRPRPNMWPAGASSGTPAFSW